MLVSTCHLPDSALSPFTSQEEALMLLSHSWLRTPDCKVLDENEIDSPDGSFKETVVKF